MFAVVANGTGADQVEPPSVENRMSRTGSPDVGLVALTVSAAEGELVDVAPPLICTVPVGAAVSR